MSFRAIRLNKENAAFRAEVCALDDDELPSEGDVDLRVEYSTINYKDALALTDKSPVVRRWPMVPGIDGAGVITASTHERWKPGERVVLNGYGAGETHWGCLAEKARLKGDCLVALPKTLTTRDAMAIGTAGYTAMLCCLALQDHEVLAGSGEVLVTGASGGVGSLAVAILSGWGYRVVASTGKLSEAAYLKSLGASEVIDRATLSVAGKPLQKERWAGVVDSVGSHTLANACAQTRYGGAVAACGLAQGMDLPTTVAPFILRGVRLIGIDSVMCPMPRRLQAWSRLETDLDRQKLASITRTIGLDGCLDAARDLMDGKVRGRVVVEMSR